MRSLFRHAPLDAPPADIAHYKTSEPSQSEESLSPFHISHTSPFLVSPYRNSLQVVTYRNGISSRNSVTISLKIFFLFGFELSSDIAAEGTSSRKGVPVCGT